MAIETRGERAAREGGAGHAPASDWSRLFRWIRKGCVQATFIRDFGGRGKIFDVDFRNVSGPMPHFVETFPDDGYVDMYRVMKALREVKYPGIAVPDHIPELKGDDRVRRAGAAYCIAYMRGLLRRANEEVG